MTETDEHLPPTRDPGSDRDTALAREDDSWREPTPLEKREEILRRVDEFLSADEGFSGPYL